MVSFFYRGEVKLEGKRKAIDQCHILAMVVSLGLPYDRKDLAQRTYARSRNCLVTLFQPTTLVMKHLKTISFQKNKINK